MKKILFALLCCMLLLSAAAAERPSFSQPTGCYEGSVTVEITPPVPGMTVIYTLDGSAPTPDNAQTYDAPLTFTESVALRAACVENGAVSGEIAGASYIFTESALDIVAIIIEPDELWHEETGLFTEGEDIVKTYGIPFANAVYAENVSQLREGMVAYIPASTGQAAFAEAVQLCTRGGYGLYQAQKSLEVYAADGVFQPAPFESAITGEIYGSFLLSNLEQDGIFTRTVENLANTLIRKYIDTDLLLLQMKQVAVYINGEYWGHYNMQESWDAYTVARYEGVNRLLAEAGEIEIATSSKRSFGSEKYAALVATLKIMSPGENAEDRAYLDEQVDIDSFIDCFALLCFFGDSDPAGIEYYQVPGGKWKCMFHENDFVLFNSSFNAVASYLDPNGMGVADLNNTVFLKILEVDEYREQFLTKLGAIWQTLTVEVMQAEVDACAAVLRPEMKLHFDRWAALHDSSINYDLPTDPEGALAYWEGRITRLRDGVLLKRPANVYTHTQEALGLTVEEMAKYFGE